MASAFGADLSSTDLKLMVKGHRDTGGLFIANFISYLPNFKKVQESESEAVLEDCLAVNCLNGC